MAIEQAERFSACAPFLADELNTIDFVARTLNPAAPKRSEAIRHLVALGYPVFVENLKRNGMQPISPPPSLAEPPSVNPNSLSETAGSHKEKTHA